MAIVGLRNLCTPAYVYLVISVITILVIALQNLGNNNVYCLGSMYCEVNNKWTIFILEFIYILLWTWFLNFLCSQGLEIASWVLVLIPYVLMFLLIAVMFLATFPDDGRFLAIDLWHFY